MVRQRKEKGQHLVEFSLVVLLLMLVTIGIADFARLYFTYATVANAAREGARYGIVHPTWVTNADNPDPDNITYRTQRMLTTLGSTVTQIQVTYPDGSPSPGNRIQVSVTVDFKTLTPLIPRLVVNSQATMYIE